MTTEPWIIQHPLVFFGFLLAACYLSWGLALGILDARKVLHDQDLPGMPMSRREKMEAAAVVLVLSMLCWPVLGLDIIDEEDDDQWPEA